MKIILRLLVATLSMYNLSALSFADKNINDLLSSTQLRVHLEKPEAQTLLSDIGSQAIEKLLEYDYRFQEKNSSLSTHAKAIDDLSHVQLASSEEEFWKIYELAHFFEKPAICHLLARQYLRSVFGGNDKEALFNPEYHLSQEAKETLRKHYFLTIGDPDVMTYKDKGGINKTISMDLREIYYVKKITIQNGQFNLSGLFLSSLDGVRVGGANIEQIDLSHNCLTTVPDILKEIKSLKVINLSHNQLKILPDCFCCALTNLECLDLSNNHLTLLPSAFGNLKCLWKFEANNNNLLSLPDSIQQCENLRWLSLKNNKLMSLPSCFSTLKNLERVDLSQNKLKDMPVDLLSKLPKLRVLNIQDNNFIKVPEWSGAGTRVLQ